MEVYDRVLPYQIQITRQYLGGVWYKQRPILEKQMEWIKNNMVPNVKGRRVRFGFDRNNWIWYFEDSKDAMLFKLQMDLNHA